MAAPSRERLLVTREGPRSERSVTGDGDSSFDTPKTGNREPDFPGSVARENCLSVKSQAPPETGNSAERSIWEVSCLNAKNFEQTRTRSPSIATEAPRRANDLRDSDDARINMQTKDKEEPNFMPPDRDSEEPKHVASETLRVAPRSDAPKTDRDDPNLAKLRTEREAPNRAQVKTNKDVLTHAIHLIVMGTLNVARLSTDRDNSQRAKL